MTETPEEVLERVRAAWADRDALVRDMEAERRLWDITFANPGGAHFDYDTWLAVRVVVLRRQVQAYRDLVPDPYFTIPQTDGHRDWTTRICRRCNFEWPMHEAGCPLEEFDHEGTRSQRAAVLAREEKSQ